MAIANVTNTLLGSYTVTPTILQQAGYEAMNGGLRDIKSGQMLPGVQYTPGETTIMAESSLVPNILQQFRGITPTTQTPNEMAGIPPVIDKNAVPGGQPEQAPQASTIPLPPPPQAQAVQAPKQTSLVDIYTSRLDLQKAFPNALTPGSPTNQALNDWWNTIGKTEYPGTSL